MSKLVDFVKNLLEILAKYACIVYFAGEKYINQYITPCINKMKIRCWVGVFILLFIGWILAKIF